MGTSHHIVITLLMLYIFYLQLLSNFSLDLFFLFAFILVMTFWLQTRVDLFGLCQIRSHYQLQTLDVVYLSHSEYVLQILKLSSNFWPFLWGYHSPSSAPLYSSSSLSHILGGLDLHGSKNILPNGRDSLMTYISSNWQFIFDSWLSLTTKLTKIWIWSKMQKTLQYKQTLSVKWCVHLVCSAIISRITSTFGSGSSAVILTRSAICHTTGLPPPILRISILPITNVLTELVPKAVQNVQTISSYDALKSHRPLTPLPPVFSTFKPFVVYSVGGSRGIIPLVTIWPHDVLIHSGNSCLLLGANLLFFISTEVQCISDLKGVHTTPIIIW